MRHRENSGHEKIRKLFEAHPNEWVPLTEVLRLQVAQYNSRIKELRAEGYTIKNKTEYVGSSKHSWFMYLPGGEPKT